uniref:NADH-ubiquinone oxidoreductase chain 5 n=1 Tax=Cladiucha punctata TaxID=2669317 RepID=A0A8F4TDM3_9HYME|nr:NADH dehydrogenase subunit 5 [Cladiucha punctata]YP_010363331.1 NADH dehydrogenase subunit 5 [Cladiucha huangbki]QXG15720.1 NADH dehydrogenase subunit 5 [Cladiucha punctata]UJM44060.1 NADH dehydrogenase subunit 5 [Cladiucha huangbki]
MLLINIFMMKLILLSFISFISSMYFLMNNLMYFFEYNIFYLNSSNIIMVIFLDWMAMIFLSVVFFISSFVIYYSKFYMEGDLMINRFIFLIIMFVLSMVLLIISPNMISILLGWDGLGLVSYCLVIYYQNIKSFNAGMLTVLSNRIGDVFLLISISWMMNFGSWSYMFYLEFMYMNYEMMLIMIFISLASFTKSAQIPFSSWLPAAMAAPTPVSSLVHSSTLVTAGVYLMIRFENLLMKIEFISKWFLLLSLLTMFMSGLNANFEYDLKKIIALSTLSQLGLMISTLLLGYTNLAFFHLLMHALFKSLMFLCAGIYIHNLMNFQDIRYMGSMSKQMPFISLCFNFSNLALCGFPFLSGFYSKDLILEMIFLMNYNNLIMIMLMISTLLTVSYTFRLIYYLMFNEFNFLSTNFLNEYSWELNKSVILLMMMVIISGSIFSWIIFPVPLTVILPFYLKIFPLILIIMGMFLGNFFYKMNFIILKNSMFMMLFFSMMWFLPIISMNGMVKNILILSKTLFYLDNSWTEMLIGQKMIFYLKLSSSLMDMLMFYLNSLLNLFFLLIMFWWYLYFLKL